MVRSTLLFVLTLLAAGSQARPKHEAEEAAATVTKTIIQVVAAPPVTVVQKVFVTEAVTVCDTTDTILLDSSTDGKSYRLLTSDSHILLEPKNAS